MKIICTNNVYSIKMFKKKIWGDYKLICFCCMECYMCIYFLEMASLAD